MKPLTLKDKLFYMFDIGYNANNVIFVYSFTDKTIKPNTIRRYFRRWLEDNYTTFPANHFSPYQYIVRDGNKFIPPQSRQRVHLINVRYNHEEQRPEFLIELEDGTRTTTKRNTLFDDAPPPPLPVRIFRAVRSYFLYH